MDEQNRTDRRIEELEAELLVQQHLLAHLLAVMPQAAKNLRRDAPGIEQQWVASQMEERKLAMCRAQLSGYLAKLPVDLRKD